MIKSSVEYINNNNIGIYINIFIYNNQILFVNNNIELIRIPLQTGYIHRCKYERKDVRWIPIKKNIEFNNFITINNTCFLNNSEVPGHIGHTLFDSIASQISTLKQSNIEMNKETKIITIQIHKHYEKKVYDIKDIYKTIFGSEICFLDEINQKYENKPILIKKLILGSSKKGVSFYNTKYTADNGYKNAWRDFRDYFYLRYDINTEKEPNKILFINTEKNGRKDRILDNNNDVSNLIKKFDNSMVINWQDVVSLKQQLKLLSQTKCFISICGTAGLNSIFLRDNTIFINLGVQISKNNVGYMDDYVFPALNIKLIYFHDFVKNRNNYAIDLTILEKMINEPNIFIAKNNYSNFGLNLIKILEKQTESEKNNIIFNMLANNLAAGCSQINLGITAIDKNKHYLYDYFMKN